MAQESTHKFIQLLTKQLREQRQKAQDLEEQLADKDDFIDECKTRVVHVEEQVKLHDKAIERLEKKTQANSTRIEQLEEQLKALPQLKTQVEALKAGVDALKMN